MGSARSSIRDALVTKIKTIDGTGDFESNLFNNVIGKLKFLDEVNDFPYVCVNTGPEVREYLPANQKWGYITYTIRVYVKAEDPETELEKIFEDIEIVIDENYQVAYTGGIVTDVRIISIETDEGLLAPLGVGELELRVQYSV